MSGFDESPGPEDSGLFFAGIGAEDEDLSDDLDDEDAILADTKVRPDDETTGSAPMPLLGMGAGAGGAAGLGAYASQSRAEHEKSRSGAVGSAPVVGAPGPVPEEGDQGLRVDAYGRIIDDDPWGVGGSDDVPAAFLSGAATSEAPRTRSTGGTRGSHLSRHDVPSGSQAAVPGATLGGIGNLPSSQGAATVASSGSQQGGIPLSVLQNLQNNKASSAAFAPMTGVQASGSHGYLADPSIIVAQAFGASEVGGIDGASSQEWLRAQLREHEYRGSNGNGIAGTGPGGLDGVDAPEGADTEDESPDGEKDGTRRGNGRGAASAAGVGAVGAGGWGAGSSTSGAAPVTRSAPGDSQNRTDWGWGSNPGQTPATGFTGTRAAGSQGVDSTGFTPGGGSQPSSPGTSWSGGGGVAPGTSSSVDSSVGNGHSDYDATGSGWTAGSAFARGSDFSVSSDELAHDAEQWRRLALEMEGVNAITGSMQDGESAFGLISEPAVAYSRAIHQGSAWSAQATKAFEDLANQLHATAAGYNANEQAAVDGTGRVFEA